MLRTVLASFLLAALVGCGVSGPGGRLKGKPAPEISPDFALNGETVSLADLKGKVVLLDFWAVWCGPCRAVFPDLTRLHETYHRRGLEVIGLTRYYARLDFRNGGLVRADPPLTPGQERRMLGEFVSHFRLPYRIQAVPQDDFDRYDVTGIPTAVLIDRQGAVRMVKVGGDVDDMRSLQRMIERLLSE